jgi:hypothetical protein
MMDESLSLVWNECGSLQKEALESRLDFVVWI